VLYHEQDTNLEDIDKKLKKMRAEQGLRHNAPDLDFGVVFDSSEEEEINSEESDGLEDAMTEIDDANDQFQLLQKRIKEFLREVEDGTIEVKRVAAPRKRTNSTADSS
jgi:hypothetical protein